MLTFRREFHYDRMMEDEKRRQAVVEALARVFGIQARLRCELHPEAESKETRARPGRGHAPRPQRLDDVLNTFPGSEVEEEG